MDLGFFQLYFNQQYYIFPYEMHAINSIYQDPIA
jgi:hypothetical protein